MIEDLLKKRRELEDEKQEILDGRLSDIKQEMQQIDVDIENIMRMAGISQATGIGYSVKIKPNINVTITDPTKALEWIAKHPYVLSSTAIKKTALQSYLNEGAQLSHDDGIDLGTYEKLSFYKNGRTE